MRFFKYWHKERQIVKDNEDNEFDLNCWGGSDISAEDAENKARVKLQNAITRLTKGLSLGDYDYQNNDIREELIEELYNEDQQLIAVISRNRYGALVLNTDAVVFVDVDIPNKTFIEWLTGLFGKKTDKQAQTLAHIKACHANYSKLNFIIYQTFAGFRVIITGHNYPINAAKTTELFNALKADKLYVKLCKVQQCFRARLTPKPWRCQSERPRSFFPRNSVQQAEFETWLQHYNAQNQQYAVCYKLEHTGKHSLSSDEARIIALHDQYVLQATQLPLA